MPEGYPVEFDVEYPDRKLSRLTTFFRIFTVIPIAIVIGLLQRGAGVIFPPLVLMLLFRRKYPAWWYDWNREMLRFSNRVGVYFALMDDRYPSTDAQQSVRLELPDVDGGRAVNRWLPLIKWLLALPHYIVLLVLGILAFIAVVIAWFAILITGRYPRPLFTFVEGVLRWQNRVVGYAFALVTDRYPPFRLSA